jgi:hypothetical protein
MKIEIRGWLVTRDTSLGVGRMVSSGIGVGWHKGSAFTYIHVWLPWLKLRLQKKVNHDDCWNEGQ